MNTAPASTEERDRGERLLQWVRDNQRQLTIVGVGLAVIVGGVWFYMTWQNRREAFARTSLDRARVSAESGNFALAANDLSRLLDTYRGTAAAEEAVLVMAQVRMLQDQAALAVADLEQYVGSGPMEQYRVQAYGMLGTAYEQLGQFTEAGEAYLQGAEGPGYELVLADLLIDAGRAFALARDTARATAAYERVLTEFDDAPRAAEARLRLAELRRFDMAS